MLDYKTIEVLTKGFRLSPNTLLYLGIIIGAGVFMGILIYKIPMMEIKDAVIVGVLTSLALTFGFLGSNVFQKDSHLIKIEVNDIKLNDYTFPQSKDYPYLKKENGKVYYYTLISGRNINNPWKIKKEIQDKFDEIVFNLENQNNGN